MPDEQYKQRGNQRRAGKIDDSAVKGIRFLIQIADDGRSDKTAQISDGIYQTNRSRRGGFRQKRRRKRPESGQITVKPGARETEKRDCQRDVFRRESA